ncbi:UNVERIFIED_CONTAM: Mannan endo-1,4-beta-mannosidase 7 [Sesamum calycinum]|uniref:mannan endo-1,4-beta-mannosidase n=1 Tax=Sesamum calycinum TaxID=2727403 RepID=A0AAW2MPR0_9LAMI
MFIRTRGIHFFLNGTPFYANGFNAYWLMYLASDPSQRPKVSAAFRQAAAHGLTVARTWAFSDGGYRPLQYSPGSYNEQMFKGLDFVVAEARRHGIKLILSLANNYDSFGGKKQYVNWARSRGQYLTSDDDFFRNSVVKGFYKNHIRSVLNRYNTITGIFYKNDPTIMAWELMNEPRCTSDPSGRTIQAWIMEMASYVKSIDRNHLLEIGLEGFYGQSSSNWRTNLNPGFNIGTDFIANNRIPAIDFATVHSYPDQWFQPYERDTLFNTVYSKIYASARRGGAAAGGLFWQLLAEGMDSFRDGYEIILDENSSTANVIAQQAHKLYQIRKIFSRMRNSAMWRRGRPDGLRGLPLETKGSELVTDTYRQFLHHHNAQQMHRKYPTSCFSKLDVTAYIQDFQPHRIGNWIASLDAKASANSPCSRHEKRIVFQPRQASSSSLATTQIPVSLPIATTPSKLGGGHCQQEDLAFGEGTTELECWDELDRKYNTEEQGLEKYSVFKFMRYQMVEDRSVTEQTHEIINLGHVLADAEIKLPEKFLVVGGSNSASTSRATEGYASVQPELLTIYEPCDWLIDTGANMHVCTDKSLFVSFEAITGRIVSMGNSSTVEVLGIGSVDLKLPSSEAETQTGKKLKRLRFDTGGEYELSIEVNIIVEFRDAVFIEDVFSMKTGIPSSVSLDDSLASTSISEHVEKLTNVGINPNSTSLTHEETDQPRRSKRARVVKNFGSDFITYNKEDDQ